MTATIRSAPARDRILAAARQLVTAHGFAATTIDAVLAAAGASKGAFFHHFPSKAALGRALVDEYAASDVAVLDAYLAAAEASSDDPGEQVVEFLRQFEAAAGDVVAAQPACLFISFIYESELAGAGTDEVVRDAVLTWRRRLLDKLEQAATTRPRLAVVDLAALADQVFTVFEGAFLLVRATDDPTAMRRQLAHLRHYIELLCDTDCGALPTGAGVGKRR